MLDTLKKETGIESALYYGNEIKITSIMDVNGRRTLGNKAEVNTGKGLKVHDWMRGYLTYGLPLIVIFIFLFGIYDKFFK